MSCKEDGREILGFKGDSFKRPEHVRIPTVWAKFEGRTQREDGTYPKFRIEDVTDDYVEEIIECLPQFNLDTIIGQALTSAGIDCSKQTKNLAKIWRVMIADRVSLQCVTDDEETPRLVGFNVNEVATTVKSVECLDQNQPREILAVMETFLSFRKDFNVFEMWNVDKYLDAWGLFVKTEFRKQGVAYHLLAAREPLCKALGIPATANAFGAVAASNIAEKLGFKMFRKITLPEIEKTYNIKLPGGTTANYISFLGRKYE